MKLRGLFIFLASLLAYAPAVAQAATGPVKEATPTPSPKPLDQLRFRNVGPQVSGGRLGAVAGTDGDSSLYYVGAAIGGVWKSTNAAQTWSPVFDDQDVGAIGAIAIDPNDENVVWVGTGEGAPRNDVSQGDGVYRTSDGGKTWQRVLPLHNSLISKILIDPRNANTVLVGALGDPFADSNDRGLYRTTDGGATWTKNLYVDARTGVSDMDAVARAPGVVYAGMWPYRRTGWSSESGGTQGGLFRSSDFGVTWQRLSGNGLPTDATGRIGIAIAPSNPQRVYALIESKQGLLWRSDDGGSTWRMMSASTLIDERPFYYTHVFVDPTNQEHLWALSVATAVSDDGGKTFVVGIHGIHGDNHAMWLSHDAKRIIEGNDGGPAFSFDDGKSWHMPHNLPIAQLYHVGFDRMKPYDVCAPLQDNGVWCAPNNGLGGDSISSSQWLNMGGGDGTWVLPDPRDPAVVWLTSGGGNFAGELDIMNVRTNESRSAGPYFHDQNVVDPKNLRYRFNWETPIAFDPFDARVAYLGGNVLFRSTDRGYHWRRITGDLTRNVAMHQVVTGGITLDGTGAETSDSLLYIEPSILRRGELWIGTDDGYVQLTRDGGRTWRNVTPPVAVQYGRFAGISASSRSPGTAYVVYDAHMVGDRAPYFFATRDYGMHWTRMGAGQLPADQEARSVREDPRNPNILYAGLEDSLWASFDRGSHWQDLRLNLPATSIRDVRVHPDSDDLVVATHGRSLYILDDLTPLQQWQSAMNAHPGFLFPVRSAYHWNLHGYFDTHNDGAAPPYGAIVTYYLSRPASRKPTAVVLDAAGRVVKHIDDDSVTNQAGFNRFTWDLYEDAPEDWNFTPPWNKGYSDGAPVLPGTYTVVVNVDGWTLRRPLTVLQDPRTHWTRAQLAQNQAAVRQLFDDFSRVDRALNALSTVINEAPLRVRALKAAGNGSLASRVSAAGDAAQALLLTVTQNPQHNQDDDFLVDVLRERLQAHIGAFGSTFGPPTQAQLQESAALHALANERMAAVQGFETAMLAPIEIALREAKQPPLATLTAKPEIFDTGEGARRGGKP